MGFLVEFMRDLNVSADTIKNMSGKRDMLFDLRKRVKDDNGSQMIVIDEIFIFVGGPFFFVFLQQQQHNHEIHIRNV